MTQPRRFAAIVGTAMLVASVSAEGAEAQTTGQRFALDVGAGVGTTGSEVALAWHFGGRAYWRAVADDPDRPEYRIASERAMLEASRAHAAAAAAREEAGDLNGALHACRRAYALDPSNGQAAVKIANLQQTLRERAEASRAPPPIEALREQARQQMQPPLLDPASDTPLTVSTSTRRRTTARRPCSASSSSRTRRAWKQGHDDDLADEAPTAREARVAPPASRHRRLKRTTPDPPGGAVQAGRAGYGKERSF